MNSVARFAVARYMLAGALVLLNAAATNAWATDQISIGVSKTPLSAPFFIADAKGMFAAEGLDVRLHECVGGNRCLQLVLDDQVDLGTASDLPVMFQSFRRNSFTVLATFVTSENDVKIVSRRSLGITQPSHLTGKRVGIIAGSASEFFLDAFALYHDIDPATLTPVPMKPTDMPDALRSGQVDALSVWEPFGFLARQALNDSDDIVAFDGEHVYRLTFNLISARSWLSTHPMEARKLLRALDRAVSFIEHSAEASKQIVVERLSVDRAAIDWSWADYHYALTLDQILLLTLEGEARWATERKLVEGQMPNYLRFIAPDALSSVRADAVTILH